MDFIVSKDIYMSFPGMKSLVTQHWISLYQMAFHKVHLAFNGIHYIEWHYIEWHYIEWHYIEWHYIKGIFVKHHFLK